MHDFKEKLKMSHEAEDLPCWAEIYHKAFPNVAAIISHRDDGEHQRKGIDRSVILTNAKQIWIDEKARDREYGGDILLEYISNDRTGALGWVEKPLLCDYIAVAYIPSAIAFLLPVLQLQAAWAKNREEWVARYKLPPARNSGYSTLNAAVPTDELYPAMGSFLRVRFTAPAPKPEPVAEQWRDPRVEQLTLEIRP